MPLLGVNAQLLRNQQRAGIRVQGANSQIERQRGTNRVVMKRPSVQGARVVRQDGEDRESHHPDSHVVMRV